MARESVGTTPAVTPSQRLDELAGVVPTRSKRDASIAVARNGAHLTKCRNTREALEFVGQLYPVGFKLAGPYGPLELGAQCGAQNSGSAVGQ